jgi:hypothetical protein
VAVLVLDRHKKPLMPCTEKRARLLLERDRARVVRMVPFTIRLVDRTVERSETQPLILKIDPGSKATGMGHRSAAPCMGAPRIAASAAPGCGSGRPGSTTVRAKRAGCRRRSGIGSTRR